MLDTLLHIFVIIKTLVWIKNMIIFNIGHTFTYFCYNKNPNTNLEKGSFFIWPQQGTRKLEVDRFCVCVCVFFLEGGVVVVLGSGGLGMNLFSVLVSLSVFVCQGWGFLRPFLGLWSLD